MSAILNKNKTFPLTVIACSVCEVTLLLTSGLIFRLESLLAVIFLKWLCNGDRNDLLRRFYGPRLMRVFTGCRQAVFSLCPSLRLISKMSSSSAL